MHFSKLAFFIAIVHFLSIASVSASPVPGSGRRQPISYDSTPVAKKTRQQDRERAAALAPLAAPALAAAPPPSPPSPPSTPPPPQVDLTEAKKTSDDEPDQAYLIITPNMFAIDDPAPPKDDGIQMLHDLRTHDKNYVMYMKFGDHNGSKLTDRKAAYRTHNPSFIYTSNSGQVNGLKTGTYLKIHVLKELINDKKTLSVDQCINEDTKAALEWFCISLGRNFDHAMKRAITIKTDVYNAFEHANFNTVEGLKTYAGKARECIKNNSVKERDAGYSDDYPTAAAKPPANNLPPAVATTSGNRDDHLADGMASMNIIDKKGKRKAGGK